MIDVNLHIEVNKANDILIMEGDFTELVTILVTMMCEDDNLVMLMESALDRFYLISNNSNS